jgi:hypothetical protein
MKRILLASAGAFALCTASPALADISSDLSLDDMNLQGPGWVENHIRLTGDAAVPLGFNDLSLQGSGQYEYVSEGGFDFSAGTFALTPFWTGSDMRVALSVGRTQVLNFSTWNSGVGAEFFVSPDFTIAAKGGAWWGTYGQSGGYVGGQATYYWTPDLALSATVDYAKVPFVYDTAFKARAEYRVWDNVSIYGGYTFNEEGHTPAHLLTIGLKLYCNGNGATTLVDEQRSGTVGYISTFDPLWFHD